MVIRKATIKDLPAVSAVYEAIHDAEESSQITIGWQRGVYPTDTTAAQAIARGDLFVLEAEGNIAGSGIINSLQVPEYALAPWEHNVPNEQVCVLHTLVIAPAYCGRGFGRAFIEFYEQYARQSACKELRIDTNAKNTVARAMYKKYGYKEVAVTPVVFNGIEGVQLVMLEKYLD